MHPTFYNTATGQLEARRPNTMNAPHHKASQAERFRSIVQARDGHTLLSFDYKGFHALYLAWEAKDKVMERVARLDMPSFATAHFLKLPKCDEAMSWPDDQLRDWLKWVKSNYRHVRDAKLKHALHGYDNGMRTHGCYMRYRDFFTGKKEVERILSMLDNLFSGAFAFRKQCVELAHEQGYLFSKFGCIRYFWEIKKWVGPPRRAVAEDGLVTCGAKVNWKECEWRGTPDAFEHHWKAQHCWQHGDDAESAASFIQQNHAHCHLKDVMLQLSADGWLQRAGFLTSIHDDLFFECPNDVLDEARVYIQSIMEAPNATTGLSVGVEPKQGPSWNAMSEILS